MGIQAHADRARGLLGHHGHPLALVEFDHAADRVDEDDGETAQPEVRDEEVPGADFAIKALEEGRKDRGLAVDHGVDHESEDQRGDHGQGR